MPQDLREKRHLEVDERHTWKAANTASEAALETQRILEGRDAGRHEVPRDIGMVRVGLNVARVAVNEGLGLDRPASAEGLGRALQEFSSLERSRRTLV